ncbi:MAG: glycosyltransferase family 2 protein [Magnetococcales bacterium]|nr:glycosyltransferase family 2 protein [Magnetococcales bacterium]MBF0418763.1 glycosyltransferase family 2 protein [Magnetococcales bacterium]
MANPAPLQADGPVVYILFPCYNEEEGLEKLLLRIQRIVRLKQWKYRLVIVNDGSTDHTREVVESFMGEMHVDFINFDKNKGVVAVFNTGFGHILNASVHPEDVVITIDSDNTMNPYVILDLMEKIREADVVIASRFVPGGMMIGAGYRAYLSYLAAFLMRWRVNLPNVTDYSIFFRAYRIELIRHLWKRYQGRPVEGQGFSCMANLLLRIYDMRPDTRFGEVPLVLRYDQKKSKSSIRIFETILGYLKLAYFRSQ